ncbi:MAG: MTAP family purine nucleoside phosphorylase [Planctomycetota bacterium]
MQTDLAVIGGSETHRLILSQAPPGRGSRIKNFFAIRKKLGRIKTPFGKSSPIFQIRINSDGRANDFLLLCRHGDKGYQIAAPFVNYRANLYALKQLGVTKIIAWSGPGALKKKYRVGELVLPDDLVDETKKREDTFFKNTGLGFVRQYPVFCPTLTGYLKKVLRERLIKFQSGGTYVCTEGPRLETPAEIKKFVSFGGDLVGMTLAPEVFLAKELEICYTALCYVSNYAEGVYPGKKTFKPGVLFEGLLDGLDRKKLDETLNLFPQIFAKIIKAIAQPPKPKINCQCQSYLERYRKSGLINKDWYKNFRD